MYIQYIQYICIYQSFYFEKTSIKRMKLLKYTPLTETEPIQHAALKNDLPLRGQRIWTQKGTVSFHPPPAQNKRAGLSSEPAFKTLTTFHYTDWFIGILYWLIIYNPHIIGQYNPYINNQPGFWTLLKCHQQYGWLLCGFSIDQNGHWVNAPLLEFNLEVGEQ